MPDESTNYVTRVLHAAERGEAGAVDELLPLLYDELRSLAFQKLSREPAGQTLQASVDRIAISRALKQHGHLSVTRRLITPPIKHGGEARFP